MTLSAHDAVRHIEHTLASDSVPGVGAMRILNDAGEFLVNMHNWRWLEGTERSLDLSKDISYVWLPEDFRELIALQTTDGLNAGIRMTTQRQLVRLRSMSVANSYVYHAAVVHAQRQAAASSQLTCSSNPADTNTALLNDGINPSVTFTFSTTAGTVLETATAREVVRGSTSALTMVAFTDAINAAPALYFKAADNNTTTPDSKINLTYARPGLEGNLGAEGGWFTDTNSKFSAAPNMTGGIGGGPPRARLDIWPTPTSDATAGIRVYYRSGWMPVSDEAQMLYLPGWMETLYLFLVRAFARSYEREGDGSVSVRLQDLKAGPLFVAAQQRDKEMTYDIGPMMNGAVHTSNPDPLWNFSSTAGPS